MAEDGPLLFELLLALRRLGLPLGIDDYLALNDALDRGLGLEDLESFQFTCRLMWAKSVEDQALFDEVFARVVEPRLRLRSALPQAAGATPVDRSSGARLPRDVAGAPSASPHDTGAEDGDAGAPWQRGLVPIDVPALRANTGAPQPAGVYQLTSSLPLGKRQMTSIWRHLRRLQRAGPAVDLDVQATVDRISEHGFLLRPVMAARRRNQARLLLLVDCSSNMAAFGPLVEALLDSVRLGGLLSRATAFYFDGYPGPELFALPGLVGARPAGEVLREYAKDGGVAIVSEAGAARRQYSRRQVEGTRAFLEAVRAVTYRYAWLNPAPIERWPRTTAGALARMAPMYPLDREGLIDAVDILRGRPFPPGVDLDAGR